MLVSDLIRWLAFACFVEQDCQFLNHANNYNANNWIQEQRLNAHPIAAIEKIISAYGRDVAILPPQEVAAIIASSGFDAPVLFFQTFLIHAWYAKRTQWAKSDRHQFDNQLMAAARSP